MPLQFNAAWRFEGPQGEAPFALINEFSTLINRISSQRLSKQATLEHFKAYFAAAAGTTSSRSSSVSWASSDLDSYMTQASTNLPLFIEAFYDGCEALKTAGIGVPDVRLINRLLAQCDVPYRIEPPALVSLAGQVAPVAVQHQPPTLDQQALEALQNALSTSERLLSEGNGRQAVQEVLWVLETATTAFRGVDTGAGTVQGKYFNRIVNDLKTLNKGTLLNQVLGWIEMVHGYLSSPTGGGIRHGADVASMSSMQAHEARLFCNLIRSYISYLMDEHTKLVGKRVLTDY